MTGIAAALAAPGLLDALAEAMIPRGQDLVDCKLPPDLEVCLRGAMPEIPQITDYVTGGVVAALAIDGIASATALEFGYRERGPAGMLDGDELYAVILADAEHEALVLARNGDGPSLYYAPYGSGWLAASEPAALVRAGIGGYPDPELVRQFIDDGACDRDERTLFAQVDRVLAGEVVMLIAGRAPVRYASTTALPSISAERALTDALAAGLGLLVAPGRAGGALLGAAIERLGHDLPLHVHAIGTPRVLTCLADGVAEVTTHEPAGSGPDWDRLLLDLGEPVGDLGLYQAWAVGRDLPGGTDVLVDSSTGDVASVARVSDRLAARYGVSLRCPLRAAGVRSEAQLAALVTATLPPKVADRVEHDPASVAAAGALTAAQVLAVQHDEIEAALAVPRPWRDQPADLATDDPEMLLRAYQVERWLAVFGVEELTPPPPDPAPRNDEPPVDDPAWARVVVRTAIIEPGSSVSEIAAWYAAAAVDELAATHRGPWFAVLSGKAVAVAQGHVRPLWDIRPGLAARALARLARRRHPHLAHRWTMQVAVEQSGLVPVTMGVLFGRLMPATVTGLFAPRPTAVAPADSSVVGAPVLPEDAARSMIAAMARSLPAPVAASLAGVAVAAVDPAGVRLFALVDGPSAATVPNPRQLLHDLLADDPAEQGGPHTPVVLCLTATPASTEAAAAAG